MKNDDPRFKQVVMNRGGRPGRKSVQDMQHLAIPTNITGVDAAPPSKPSRRDTHDTHSGFEVYYKRGSSTDYNRDSRESSSGSFNRKLSALSDDILWCLSSTIGRPHERKTIQCNQKTTTLVG